MKPPIQSAEEINDGLPAWFLLFAEGFFMLGVLFFFHYGVGRFAGWLACHLDGVCR